jgi:predicted nuclease with TOPRIM domain
MKIKFTDQEIKDIIDIIEEYRDVSKELYAHQDKAKEIQEKVTELEGTLKLIKEKEDSMMSELHSKYGEFGIQDVYDSIYDRGL